MDPRRCGARYLVGCDGGRSTVRKLLGVGFPGTDATRWNTAADVMLGAGTARPPAGWTSMGAARQAEKYRVGRVFLAGDAAHVHLPIGGQGLNTGVQDAFNLGWKLATVLAGRVSDGLLDTYETERHPVGARVLANVRAQSAVQGPASELFHTGHGVLLATDEKYLAPALPYRGRIVSTAVDALPWGEVEAALVRPDGYVFWTAPGEDVIGPAQAWFGSPR